MFNIGLKEVHVGEAIRKRLEELQMSKTEFGRLAGIRPQHVNKLLERDSIETQKLVKISNILQFNFFTLFCSFHSNINASLAAISLGGDGTVINNVADGALIAQNEVLKEKVEGLTVANGLLKEQVGMLKDQINLLNGSKKLIN